MYVSRQYCGMSIRWKGGKASKLVSRGMWWAHTMVRWWRLNGTSAIGGPVRRRVAPLTREGEDSEMGKDL